MHIYKYSLDLSKQDKWLKTDQFISAHLSMSSEQLMELSIRKVVSLLIIGCWAIKIAMITCGHFQCSFFSSLDRSYIWVMARIWLWGHNYNVDFFLFGFGESYMLFLLLIFFILSLLIQPRLAVPIVKSTFLLCENIEIIFAKVSH